MRGCAARAWRGFSAWQDGRGGSITSPAPRLSRATSRSGRWAEGAFWRGRTGFTTGGCERKGIARCSIFQSSSLRTQGPSRRGRCLGHTGKRLTYLLTYLLPSPPVGEGGVDEVRAG